MEWNHGGMINLYNITVHQIFEWWETRISILHSKICLGIIGDRLEPLDTHIPPYLILLSALAETSKKIKKNGKMNQYFLLCSENNRPGILKSQCRTVDTIYIHLKSCPKREQKRNQPFGWLVEASISPFLFWNNFYFWSSQIGTAIKAKLKDILTPYCIKTCQNVLFMLLSKEP